MQTIAIDPGLNCGIAWHDDKHYHATTVATKPGDEWIKKILTFNEEMRKEMRKRFDIEAHTEIIIEKPCFYEARIEVAKSENLVKLAMLTGGIIAMAYELFADVEFKLVQPQEWKGQLDKSKTKKRVMKRLGERVNSWSEHAIDACGILMWHRGEF